MGKGLHRSRLFIENYYSLVGSIGASYEFCQEPVLAP